METASKFQNIFFIAMTEIYNDEADICLLSKNKTGKHLQKKA